MDVPILRFDRYNSPGPHILSVGPRVSVEIVRGRVRQRVRPILRRVFLIGTASDCDLVLGDLTFPEAYAYLFVQEGKVSIRRLAAGPPLIVGGEQVEMAELFDADRVAFGPFELQVMIDMPVTARRACKECALPGDDEVTVLLADIRRGLADDPSADDWRDAQQRIQNKKNHTAPNWLSFPS